MIRGLDESCGGRNGWPRKCAGWYGLGMEDPDQDGGGEEQAAVDPARVGALLGVDGVLREA